MKIAVFPGSFDPVTLGHLSVIEAVAPLFDKIYVAIGVNADKPGCFPVEQRKQWLQQVLSSFDNIEIIDYNGLTVDLCKSLNAKFLVRGLRNAIDFQYEKDIAEANRRLAPEIETIFLLSSPELAHVSSSLVRELYHHQGNYSDYVSFEL